MKLCSEKIWKLYKCSWYCYLFNRLEHSKYFVNMYIRTILLMKKKLTILVATIKCMSKTANFLKKKKRKAQ